MSEPQMDWSIEIDQLVQEWCDRRELSVLRTILGSWPIAQGLTDEWSELARSLKSISGHRELPEHERQAAKRLYVAIDSMLWNR